MTITEQKGKGNLRHNNRDYYCKNVDPERTKDNVTLVKQSLKECYDECFGDAVKAYNDKQKRKDRKINDYFSYCFGATADELCAQSPITAKNGQVSFYEDLAQVGDKNSCGVGTRNGYTAERVLLDYFNGNEELGIPSYQERNPQFHVFNAVIHMDEATPHLHIDYVPIATGYKNGLAVQNGYNKALEQMGYSGKDGFTKWRSHEREILAEISSAYGLEIEEAQPSRGKTYTPNQYREIMQEAEQTSTEMKAQAEDYLLQAQQIKALAEEEKQEQERLTQAKNKELEEIKAEKAKLKAYEMELQHLIAECKSEVLEKKARETLEKSPVSNRYDKAITETSVKATTSPSESVSAFNKGNYTPKPSKASESVSGASASRYSNCDIDISSIVNKQLDNYEKGL